MLTSGMNTSNVVVPAQFNTSQSNTTSVNTASYVPKRDDELLRVLRQTTTSQSDPAQRAQLAKLEEASKNFVRSTDQDKQDLKNLKDELDNAPKERKAELLSKYNNLKDIIDNGGYDISDKMIQTLLQTSLRGTPQQKAEAKARLRDIRSWNTGEFDSKYKQYSDYLYE